MSQAPVTYRKPRDGFHRSAAGHTDPHSALGMGALAGVLGAKAAMERHRLPGTIKFFGEPAEKVCGSKPVHAAHGYYDDLDAAISFHPTSLPALANSTVWDTHCGAYWSKIYTFECPEPQTWGSAGSREGTNNSHTTARAPRRPRRRLPHVHHHQVHEGVHAPAPGHVDAQRVHPRGRAGDVRQPGADLQPDPVLVALSPRSRWPSASSTCSSRTRGTWRPSRIARSPPDWVTRTRVGLPNHAMAEITYRNLELAGPPSFGEEAKAFARQIQKTLDLAPMDDPFMPEISELTPPSGRRGAASPVAPAVADELHLRRLRRVHVARADLAPVHRPRDAAAAAGRLPLSDWPRNALGGFPPAIDPLWYTAGRTIGATLVELMTSPAEVARARAEFIERTGGGIGGTKWVPPLLPKGFRAPVHYRWPEYVTTPRGEEWWIPNEPAGAP
jgi:aminobenzoyl-glutamate utilization protein B